MQLGIIGSGSWATALAKICTDNKQSLNWCVLSRRNWTHLQQRHHNPGYLSRYISIPIYLHCELILPALLLPAIVCWSAVPSAYVTASLEGLPANAFEGKKVISAVKGILPDNNLLLNDYLKEKFNLPLSDYFTVMGPRHAEEVASEKLSLPYFFGYRCGDGWKNCRLFYYRIPQYN